MYVRVDGCENYGFESLSLPALPAEQAWGLARECIPGWAGTAFPGKASALEHDGSSVKVTSNPNHWEWRLTKEIADVSKTVSIDVGFPDTVVAISSAGGSPF